MGIAFLSRPRIDESWLAALTAVLVLSASLGCAGKMLRPNRTTSSIPLMVCGAVFMSAGSVLLLFFPVSARVVAGGGTAAGLGMTLFVLEGLPFALRKTTIESLRMVTYAFIISAAIDLIALVCVDVASRVLLAAAPTISLGLTLVTIKTQVTSQSSGVTQTTTGNQAPKPSSHRHLEKTRMFTLLLAFLGFSFFMGIVGFNSDVLGSRDFFMQQVGIMTAGCVMAACVLIVIDRFLSLESLQLMIPFMLVTAMLLLPFSTQTLLNNIAISISQAVLLCTYMLLVFTLQETAMETSFGDMQRYCAWVIAAVALCQLLGIIAGGILRNMFDLDLTVMMLVVIFVLYLAFLFILVLTHGKKKVEHVILGTVASKAEIAQIRCDVFENRYSQLSSRELEVLSLLLQNYSNERIAKALVVSGNTIKTHVRHIYAKMGINSRQQLLGLAEDILLGQNKE